MHVEVVECAPTTRFNVWVVCSICGGIVTLIFYHDVYDHFEINWLGLSGVIYSAFLCTGFGYVAIGYSSTILDPSVKNFGVLSLFVFFSFS